MCTKCAIKMNGMKTKNKIGAQNDYLMGIMMDLTPAVGAIGALEIKKMIPASINTTLGANADYIINGVGVATVVLPHVLGLKGEAKDIVRGLTQGIAAECALAAWRKYRGDVTGIGGWDNRAYALAGANIAALKRRVNMNGLDNAAPGLMGRGRGYMNAPTPPPFRVNASFPASMGYRSGL